MILVLRWKKLTLTPLGNTLEHLVYMDSLVLAYPQRGAVNETDARALDW